MVHHGHQHVLVVGDAEKPCPQRDLGGQVKRVTRRGADGLTQPVCRPAAGINDLPAEVGPLGRHHQLLGDARRAPANRVRRLSWRPTTSASAAPNASASRRPPSRNATAML